MGAFIAAVRRLSQLCGILAALLLLAAVLVVCHLVFIRYALNESAVWQHEFVSFSLIGSTFLGAPYLLLTHGHVNVDLLPLYFGGRGRLLLALLASGVSLAFCVIVGWAGFEWWHEAFAADWRGDTVWAPPLWVPYFAVPLGLGLLALQYVADIAALLTGRAMPFGLTGGGAAEPRP